MVHTLRFFVFRLRENLENILVVGRPQPPGKGRLHCLALSPPAGHTRVCYFLVLWCPALQNYAVAGCAGLFAGFEKTSIACGFARCSYETPCRFLTFEIAILAIKNTTMKKHSNKEAQQQRNTVTKKHNNKETQ